MQAMSRNFILAVCHRVWIRIPLAALLPQPGKPYTAMSMHYSRPVNRTIHYGLHALQSLGTHRDKLLFLDTD
jgi:hypothetical protein